MNMYLILKYLLSPQEIDYYRIRLKIANTGKEVKKSELLHIVRTWISTAIVENSVDAKGRAHMGEMGIGRKPKIWKCLMSPLQRS
jgi:spore coat polysaccharide biosynthesis protein SpsF (cytidylyltransferase family)